MNPNENPNSPGSEQPTQYSDPINQPTSEQPQSTPPVTENSDANQAVAAPLIGQDDPGKTLGIVSIVLDVLGLALIGAILGYLSKKKSKEAGYDGTLGQIGMIIGLVLVGLGTLVFIAYIALFAIVFSSAA
jgi:hypothetical protein